MNSLLREDTHKQQSNLAFYCRTGSLRKIEGADEERLKNYRRLVYNVIDDTLQSAFPLTVSLLASEEWNNLVEYFFANHDCKSYSVWKTAYEFFDFIENGDAGIKEKYPFLTELLYFEWIEIEIYMMEDLEYPQSKPNGSWESGRIAFNPEYKILRLEYPVHLKSPAGIRESDKGDYFVLVYREKETGRVQFLNLSVYFAWLIDTLNEQKEPLRIILKEAEKIFNADYTTLLNNSIPFLEDLKQKEFITGFLK